jgi:glucose-6-phosphate isomerase
MEVTSINKKQKIGSKKPDIRYLNDMRKVLYDKKWAKTAPNLELYYMYRGVKKEGVLRYDITIIPPRMLGKEFVKTKGHEHSGPFQELYIVLEGKAIFLMQKYNKDTREVENVFAIRAKEGESVIVPLGYGHVTINPARVKLKMANWINKKCRGIYDWFEKKEGGCYFYTKSGWIRNKKYDRVPGLRFEKPLKKIPKNLDFLK